MSEEPTGRFHMIAFNVTNDYILDEQDKNLIIDIFDVYVFDNETNHHLCSFEKHRWCKFLRTSIHFVEDSEPDDHERCEDTYIYSCVHDEEDDYFTVSTIERIRKEHPERYKVLPDSVWADEDTDGWFDDEDQPTDRCWDFFYEYTREDSWI